MEDYEKRVKKERKYFFIIVPALLIIALVGITFAFFNYTRTGVANNIQVGRIFFESKNEETINLNNLFPIDPSNTSDMNDSTKVGTYSIDIKGDTDYEGGVEYLVSTVNSNIYTSTGKIVPISLDVTVTDLGTQNNNYFTARENTNESIYKKLVGGTLVGDQMLLVGYITPNNPTGTADGIDGNITIKAYLDENKILVSDTYDGTESDNMGTPNNMAEGKTVLTTTEWNALSTTVISFKVKVEANEGIWVNRPFDDVIRVKNLNTTTWQPIVDNTTSTYVSASTGINFAAVSSDTNGKGIYMRAGTENDAYPILYYRGAVEDNNVVFNNICWKAVRTTETGGVKLIYNGESSVLNEYANEELSSYSNVNRLIDVSDTYISSFTFDSSDNTWNTELTGSGSTEFEFTVPTGDNYNLIMTGTSGSSCGGYMTFYKDGETVNTKSQGGGNAMNLTYYYGSLSSSNKIKMTYNGSSSTTCPITFKIKMEQNSSALSNNKYTILSNGINTSKKWTFDENEKEWFSLVPQNSTAKISFSVSSSGNYELKYTATGGPVSIKKGDTVIDTYSGIDRIVNLGNVSTSDEYSVEYQQMGSGSGRVEFALRGGKTVAFACDNSNASSQITLGETTTFAFNTNYNSLAYVGYMYGDVYTYNNGSATNGAYYGNSFTWDGSNYTLVDATTLKDNTHHYTCNLTTIEGTCATIRYYYYGDYYINLTGGDGIEEAMEKMQTNTNDSNAKTQIDSWYASNMNTVTSKLEDTIWCNDRSVGNEKNNGWIANGGSLTTYLYYGATERSNDASASSTLKNQPSLACKNKNDAFTVSNGNGNRKLTYPVALLTEDEMVLAGGLAGSISTYYLYTKNYYWSLSPYYFYGNNAIMFRMGDAGSISSNSVSNVEGLRPAISLKPGLPVVSGTGTASDPYVIE